MKNVIAVSMIVVFVVISQAAFAANPADVTSDTRTTPIDYQKVAYDDGPWYALKIVPVDKRTSLTLCRWRDDENDLIQNQIVLSHAFTPNLDAALDVEKWEGADDCTDLFFDFHKGSLGFGVRQPLCGGATRLGPRFKVGAVTAYLSMPTDGGKRLYGLTHMKNNLEIDFCWDSSNTKYLRASYWRGKVIPEIRLKFTPTENFYGFALAFWQR